MTIQGLAFDTRRFETWWNRTFLYHYVSSLTTLPWINIFERVTVSLHTGWHMKKYDDSQWNKFFFPELSFRPSVSSCAMKILHWAGTRWDDSLSWNHPCIWTVIVWKITACIKILILKNVLPSFSKDLIYITISWKNEMIKEIVDKIKKWHFLLVNQPEPRSH